MCKGFISSCSVEIQVVFRIQNHIHSAFQQVLLPFFSSPAAPSAARAGLSGFCSSHCSQLTTANTMTTGTLQQGCVQVFQRGSHTPPKRDTAESASGECMNRRERTAAPSKSYPQSPQVRILPDPVILQLWSSLKLCKLDKAEEFLKSFTHWHKMQ